MLPLDILHEPVWQRLAWTLLHFVWQGLVVAAAVTLLLRLAPWHRAQVRYSIHLTGLLLMAACPLVTFALLQTPTPAEEAKPPGQAMDVPEFIVVQPSEGKSAASLAPPTAAQLPGETTASRQDGGRTTSDIAPPAPRLGTASWKARTDEWARVAQPYGLIVWMVGVFLLGMRLLLSFAGVRQLIRNRCPVSAELGRRVVELSNRFGFRSMPPVFICERIREAIVVGVLRPMVLLPGCWVMEMTPDVLEAVIAHELAHIRRWDAWVNLLQRLVETLLFYHPAVWWLSHRLCLEREMCTDELAVKATGQRMTYATTLELLGRKRLNLARPQFGAAMGGGRMALLNRVRNILDISPSHERARWWPVGLLALLVPLVMLSASTYIARSGPGEARAEGTRQLDAEPDDKDSVAVQTKRGARMERDGPAASLVEMPPRHLAEVSRPGGKDPTAIAWGEAEQGLAVGIGAVRTSLKSPIWPIVEAYLENRGATSLADVPPWQAKFILELDGRFYAQNDHGGRSSGLEPGARHGPVAIKTQQFHKVARLGVHVAVEQTEPAPVLTEGEHTLRIHYRLDRVRTAGKPERKLVSSPLVTISVSHSPYPEEKATAMILGELKHSDSDVRRAAVLAAGGLRLAGCRDALVRALDDSDRVTRRYAAESLGEIGDRTAAQPLRDLLHEADMEVRLAAAASLVRLGEDLDVVSVEPIIKSKHRVFQNAIWLVRRHGDDQAVPALIRCLDMKDPSVNSYYNYTLVWQIGACGGPRLRYHHDFDGKGTTKQVEENRMVLEQLQAFYRKLPGKDTETPVASTATTEARGADIGPKFASSQNGRVELLAFSPDGKTLASVGRHMMFLDTETCKVLRELKLSGYAANSIAYSHDGAVLAAGTSTGQVRLWDTNTFQLKDTFQITRWSVYAVAISPDGGTLASCAADGTVQFWDIKAKRHLRTLGEKGDRMGSLAFSPDGRRLAALDRYAHLELWNVDTGELIGTLPREGGDSWPRVSFGPDGETLAVSSAGQIRFWNPDAAVEARMVRLPDAIDEEKKWEERLRHQPGRSEGRPIFMGMVALTVNHKTAASVNLDGTIAVWDVATRKVRYTLTGRRMPDSAGGGVDSLVFSPNGKQVAAGTRDGRVELWELP